MVVLFSSMSAPLSKLCLRAQGSRLRTTVLRTGRRDAVDAMITASIRSGIYERFPRGDICPLGSSLAKLKTRRIKAHPLCTGVFPPVSIKEVQEFLIESTLHSALTGKGAEKLS